MIVLEPHPCPCTILAMVTYDPRLRPLVDDMRARGWSPERIMVDLQEQMAVAHRRAEKIRGWLGPHKGEGIDFASWLRRPR